MGTGTFVDRTEFDLGDDIKPSHIFQLMDALNGTVVGRQDGVPTAGQSLGSPTNPWGIVECQGLRVAGQLIDASSQTAPPYRLSSGKTSGISSIGKFISIAGGQLSLLGREVNLIGVANARPFTLDSDLDLNMNVGFNRGHQTTLANVPAAVREGDGTELKRIGDIDFELGDQKIELTASVSEIAARVGQSAALSLIHI